MANITYAINGATPTVDEAAWQTLMEGFGHTFLHVVQSTALADANVDPSDLLVISAEAGSFSYDLTTKDIPVVSLSPFRTRDELDFGGAGDTAVEGSVTDLIILDAASPIANGETGTITAFNAASSWGAFKAASLPVGVNQVARIDAVAADRVVVASADPLTSLQTSTAPNYRVMFSLYQVSPAVTNPNYEGMLEEAINYALQGSIAQAYIFDTPAFDNNPTYSVGDVVSINPIFSQIGNPTAFTATVIAGTLPSGTSLNASTGVVTGTLDTIETPSVTIRVDNGEGTPADAVLTFDVLAASTDNFVHERAMSFLSFDASGDMANDVSGLDNDLTISGSVTQVASLAGKTNVALFGGGANDYINASSLIPTFGSATEFSFSAWVYSDTTGNKILFSAEDSVNGYDLTLWQNGTGLEFQNRGVVNAWDLSAPALLTANTWHLIQFTTGPNGFAVYVDKVNVPALSGVATESLANVTPDSIYIGQWLANLPFNGHMKDVYLGEHELTQSTVDDIFDNDVYGRDVIHIVGDSESISRATTLAGVDDDFSQAPFADQYGFDAQAIIPFSQPMDHQNELAGDMSYALGLARGVTGAMNYKRKLTFVPCGLGGSQTSAWQNGQTAYDQSVIRMNAAEDISELNNTRGVVVSLGTNDAIAAQPDGTVETNLTAMLTSLQTDVDGINASTKVALINPVGPDANGSEIIERDIVIADITAVAGLSVNYHQIVTNYGTFDGVHTNAAGMRENGTKIANQLYGRTRALEVVLSTPAGTKTGTYEVTATFNDKVPSFELADISVTNGTASNVAGADDVWTFDVTPNVGTGNNDIVIAAGGLQDWYVVSNSESNTLVVAYNVAGGGVPIITASPNHEAGGTITVQLSGGYTSPVSDISFNGQSYTNITEVDPNTVTATATFDGEPNVNGNLTITDAGGTSAPFVTQKIPPAGYGYQAVTDSGANFPTYSLLTGLTQFASGNGCYFQQSTNAVQDITSIDGVGVISNYIAPSTSNIGIIRLDSGASFAADAEVIQVLEIGDNIPDVQVITPVTGATPSATGYAEFDITGVVAGSVLYVTAPTGQLTNDSGSSWTTLPTLYAAGAGVTKGRIEYVAPAAGQSGDFTVEINDVEYTVNVTSQAAAAPISDVLSSTQPPTVTPILNRQITFICTRVDTLPATTTIVEVATTDGSTGQFDLVDAGLVAGEWVVAGYDAISGVDLGSKKYTVT